MLWKHKRDTRLDYYFPLLISTVCAIGGSKVKPEAIKLDLRSEREKREERIRELIETFKVVAEQANRGLEAKKEAENGNGK